MAKKTKTIQCRHCRKRFVPNGLRLIQHCPHCDQDCPFRRARRNELLSCADAMFSRYIRQNAINRGLGHCVTCGAKNNIQCGHYITRACWDLRWHPDNCHPQCGPCNYSMSRPKSKVAAKYACYLDVDDGNGNVLLRLTHIAAEPKLKPPKDRDLLVIINLLNRIEGTGGIRCKPSYAEWAYGDRAFVDVESSPYLNWLQQIERSGCRVKKWPAWVKEQCDL